MRTPASETIIDRIFQLFGAKGSMAYGESVTMEEHMLQCAHIAEVEGEDSSVVAAALLHDIGHFLHAHGEDIADKGIDGKHEILAAQFLDKHFAAEVVRPILDHVAAKRYLCHAESGYFEQLTPASVTTLEVQGGPFDEQQAAEFRRRRHFDQAVKVRRLDERGKVPGMTTPNLESFRSRLEALLLRPV